MVVVIIILLSISFVIILKFKKHGREIFSKYQVQDCNEVTELYGDENLKENAIDDWFAYYKPRTGMYQ